MEKALNTLEFLSQDEQTRQRYEARQKALHDYASAITHATETGHATGRQEGRAEGERHRAVQVAKRLLLKDTPIVDVANLTGLLEHEVRDLADHVGDDD